ncbi:MAG TPA: alpha/beta hydrolase [Rhodanobacteraceae bacterium]|jgi:acetyl esterase/lipase|nr:alpha/beta hydrolase [Rhodanobacteraceae bacterium]
MMLLSSIGKKALTALLFGALTSTSAHAMQATQRPRMGGQEGNRGLLQRLMRRGNPQPLTLPSGARLLKDVAYGSDERQKMDVYIPQGAHDAPVILMVHGGGWRRGNKELPGVVQNKIDYFLPKGYIFISTNYRLVPEVTPVTEAEDVAHALAYGQQHAREWGADPSRFVLMGHSAGAHLVVLVSSAPSIWQGAGAKAWLGTVGLDSGAYNVAEIMNQRHFGLYDIAFGDDPQLWQEASPTLRLHAAPPPMLLVCDAERLTSCAAARAYADKAQSLGGRVTVFPVSAGHGEINASVGTESPLTSRIDQFLQSVGLH